MTRIYSVTLGGDVLKIVWDGNIFLTSNGESHSTRRRAQLEEVRNYYGSFQEFFPEEELEQMVDCNLVFVLDEA